MNLVISVCCDTRAVSRSTKEHKMWTKTTREQYRREGLGYAGVTTDAQWAMIEPLMPAVKRLGGPAKWI
jgi:hypothetical protein